MAWFQFYLSSIKSRVYGLSTRKQLSFNSTLVQLKVKLPDISIIVKKSFNSTLVQLKDFRDNKYHQG